ncbi:ATP-binding cassette domain-containing protein [Spiroplasma endosymbiont of Diplazon laetatorius]|uniref:ABC transporter ATP-binding protein n=1 Tax=Spiroplasma endosymbiont of Diplazon laetatorius TaxID=3066322 RepID=UPI0030D5C135
MIKINNISKIYGSYLANEDITLTIEKGEIFGVLGPNGAGKTTLISQIMGFIKSTKGDIIINGFNPWLEAEKVMNSVGFIAGEIKLYENMKVKDFIKIYKNLNENVDDSFLSNLIKLFELDLNKKIKLLSKGNKQKVSIICSLMSKPKILILDEPTSGLDPIMQNKFNILMLELKKQGTTIILCSHIFQEIEKLCDRVVLLKEGKMVEVINLVEGPKIDLEKKFNETFKVSNNQIEEMVFNYE